MDKYSNQELDYKKGYKDATKDFIDDLISISGKPYEAIDGNHKVIINIVDLMCLLKKYGSEFEDEIKDKLSDFEIEKLSKVEVSKNIR